MSTQNLRTVGYYNAQKFVEGFSLAQPTVAYVTIGKVTPWNDTDTPPALDITNAGIYEIFNNMIAGKRIYGGDLGLVLPRINWESGIVYTQYDDRSNSATLLSSANSTYVLTTNLDVYQCLDNANNSTSTVEPTGDYSSNNGFIRLPDGYVWKYMYRVPLGNTFLTDQWMPVPTNSGPAYFSNPTNVVDGGLSRVAVENGGSGYDGNTVIRIIGNGSGANVIATVSGGSIVSCNVQNVGSGYTYQNCSAIAVGTGTSANLRIILPPSNGHADNPAVELGANTVMVTCRIGYPESTEGGKITIQNDYRQIALLLGSEGLHKYGQNTDIVSANANSVVVMTPTILVTSGVPYSRDEIVYQGTDLPNATYQAAVVDYSFNKIYVSEQRGTIRIGQTLKGNTTMVSRTVASYVSPELDYSSGDLAFVANRPPVMRMEKQAEQIKFLILF